MLEQIVIESATKLIVNLVKQINETNSHLDVVPVTITYDMIKGNITYDDLVKDKLDEYGYLNRVDDTIMEMLKKYKYLEEDEK